MRGGSSRTLNSGIDTLISSESAEEEKIPWTYNGIPDNKGLELMVYSASPSETLLLASCTRFDTSVHHDDTLALVNLPLLLQLGASPTVSAFQ